mgnify:CR=1 FL=1
MNIGGLNFTNFSNVRLKGTKDGTVPGALRVVATSAFEGTLSVNTDYQDANYQWTLPAKSGGIPIMGTFRLSLPVGNAINAVISTAVTVVGLRVEDAVMCTFQRSFATAGIAIVGAVPTADVLTVYISNTTGIGLNTLNVVDGTVAYVAFR